DQGRTVSAGGVDEAIGVLEKLQEGQAALQKCCEDILKRLDKLDEIANMLQKMTGENDALRKELADLRKQQEEMDAYVKGLPKALTAEQTTAIVDTRTAEQLERARMPKFSILGLNVGADGNGDLTFTGRGRYFSTFKEQFGVQIQGEYMYFRDRQEGQMDVGLVNRFARRAQAGGFASFRRIDMRDMQSGGTLGQASATLDYLFSRGRLGIFGTKGFMNEAVINRAAISRNIFDETYLRVVDQWGASTTLGLAGNLYMEGNVGYLNSRGQGNKVGFTTRFIQPISERFAFTIEGGMNETLLGSGNNGRVVAGFQFGNFMPPKNYLEGHNDIQHAVPADVPRIRYELLTRRVRTGGNDPPVADAGPDQIGVAAGSITLDGSGSYDPDEDPITFRWLQVAGPTVSLAGMNSETATFSAEEGQTYTFRLTVSDDKNAQATARVTVTTTSPEDVQIVRFQASPDRVSSGQPSTIDWQVLNADSVTITEIGDVDAKSGNRQVTPTRTTTYSLTARNSVSEATATTTIVVEGDLEPTILACQVSPTNIMPGENATIFYSVQNADEVTISGIGSVPRSGSQVVSPAETTTYEIAARNASGAANCSVTVQVTGGTVPRILRFTAAPMQISSGQSSTLAWGVENATEVSISGIGTVDATGTRDVQPTATTTYTLTAKNANGEVTATAMVTVAGAPGGPTVTACAANPSTSAKPGDPVVLAYTTNNAQSVSIEPAVANPPLNGPV
ncbi:MAG: PKD domain-containing protein, partial [Bryobacteraceae bacterium]